MLDPFFGEALGEMLDCIETEAREAYLGGDPGAPVLDVFAYFGVVVREVCEPDSLYKCAILAEEFV